ncbi:DNA helicase [Anaerocolumna cellulosilytica]|uniref:DNA 3'-5' helicase n=1 Tax=Anaerocolumna cellulosilytica TaxID=433286 RepID=A0A6S6QRA7_9FIRM|nr:ATP-dependent helicase [Anaerocolumna cellulosilytica]MBB5198026.1 DNA helicase-2/ATP-dependent DNA helicase PcrA [Anaerocolumna cellulosilytica]BCJ93144.1 DNA helicase [Anaerocolumna cellulosilytica]
MEMNQAQINAINHNTGPMLVLAGPGSGKTLVITKRTLKLIEEYGINPHNILVITFTKAAAEEMKERFEALTGRSSGVNFGTFHAVFFTILKYAYQYNASNIIRDEQRNQFLKEIVEQLTLEIDDEKEFISGVLSEISLVKGERMDIEHYYSINCSEDIFKKIYRAYDSRLRKSNLIDFDDMLVLCYELLAERPDILAIWQKKYQYILIDEFQDINKVQYDIIRLLAQPQNNLFIVGDDDQSIYRFRGAKPDIMLNFERDYPEGVKILLDINYRSTKKIVHKAACLIKNNGKRFAKNIKAIKETGQDIVLINFKELKEQNSMVVADILKYYKKGIPFSQMAVLFRTNTQPRALIDKLMEYNVPFQMKDVIPNIYDHWIASNIMAYIRIAMGSRDRALFLQISNRPKRYLSRECFEDPIVDFNRIREFYNDKEWMIDRIHKLEYDISLIKNMNPYAAINYIRKGIGYEDYLTEYAQFRRIKIEELLDTLNELQEASKEYNTFAEWFDHINEYQEELKRQAQQKKYNKDSVSLATMHSSKGLEYQVVIIVDANEGITPHRKAILEADLEEERRLFYVAMTRAKEYLHIYSVKERYNKELSGSRFVGELLLERNGLKPGVEVEHKTYGLGQIKKNQQGKITIYFEQLKKERTLDLEFCIQNQLLTIKE